MILYKNMYLPIKIWKHSCEYQNRGVKNVNL